ncbi:MULTISPECIES: ATP-binding cassette domain-containing protein [unclassified Enterococcus]|uniref:ATP-binding cassette domain-containing protein n=2 Tax=Candidatus Enterococcus ikei TaxID=2815326 RepID=A0ABS3GZM0_9ENTE|nr:ATP-binding cassette domain-containing protein [Enterococcus sp. DIV0869a]MBO1355429.1 ATP-binding cassette domain-containing protein [Enterococcus sp. DIV0212c]
MNQLQVKNIGKKYEKVVFQDVSFKLNEGQILGILGKNGTGKTTLLDCLAGQKKVTTGMLMYNDHTQNNELFQSDIAYVSTKDWFEESETIQQILKEYTILFPSFQLNKAVDQLLLWQISIKQKWHELSQGSKVKVKIVCEYAKATNILLLDEPFAYLDYSSRLLVKKMLRKASGENKIIVVSTNFIEDMDTLFTDVLFMNPFRYCEVINLEELREQKGLSLKEIYKEEADDTLI